MLILETRFKPNMMRQLLQVLLQRLFRIDSTLLIALPGAIKLWLKMILRFLEGGEQGVNGGDQI